MKNFIEIHETYLKSQGLFKEKIEVATKSLIPIKEIKSVTKQYSTGKAVIWLSLRPFAEYNLLVAEESYEDVVALIAEASV